MIKEFHKGISAFGKVFNIDITPVAERWAEVYTKRLKTQGKASAVAFAKALNTCAERYALHQPIDPIPWTKSSRDGFPRVISMAKPYLRNENSLVVMLTLSVFRTVELLRLPISKDISTVINPSTKDYSEIVETISEFIPTFVDRLRPIKIGKMEFHLTMKNGPNGPALKTSDIDTHIVLKDPKLRDSIRKVEELLKEKSRCERRGSAKDQSIHSKLVQFPEKSGKTRTIAIIDYYSQRCLKPLHEGLMGMLRKMENDGTYSHNEVGKFAKDITLRGAYAYCADLTAFTDRFPAILQKNLLFKILRNDDLANAFWTLLAERQFKVAWNEDVVSYSVGQPMGAYSSWALCALAHHLVVQYCANSCGVKNYKSIYRLIGDDIIICDQDVASKYREVISSLDVTINLGKTVESIPNNYNCAEVAKQLYLNGKCLTPLTPGIIKDLRIPYMFNTCLGLLKSRYDFEPDLVPMLVDAFHRKEENKKLAWLLISEPLNGIVTPGMPGYDGFSPWATLNVSNYRSRYLGIYFTRLQNKSEDLYADLLEYLNFKDGPLADRASSQKPSFAMTQVLKGIKVKYERLTQMDQYCTDQDELTALADEFAYLPDPYLPFMERKRLRNKRLSSIVEYCYKTMSM